MKLDYFETDGQSYYEAVIWDKTGNFSRIEWTFEPFTSAVLRTGSTLSIYASL